MAQGRSFISPGPRSRRSRAGRIAEVVLTAERDLLRVNEIVSVTGRADELIAVEADDVDYFYESRLPSEPMEAFSDVHFHPLQSRSVRFFVDWRP